jgi:2-dehydropantoate 2-reductase
MVRFGCGYQGPGQVQHLTEGFLKVGELDGTHTARLDRVSSVLGDALQVDQTDNVLGWLWTKETYGCLLEMTALVDDTITGVLELPGAAELARAAMAECVRVAVASGVRLEEFDFLSPIALLDDSAAGEARRQRDIEAIKRNFGHTKSGVWRDIAVRKIPTEVRYTAGSVIVRGKEVGVATPYLEHIVRMVEELESGRRRMTPSNLDELREVAGSQEEGAWRS